MYLQMNHTDLIASSPSEYVSLVLRLLSDRSFQQSQAQQIEEKFREKIHQNHEVIREWLGFLCRLTQ
jgi:predicted O-linked N-acetylglucosamine transferase (SPINDLY family)